jgi:hypothetical protein
VVVDAEHRPLVGRENSEIRNDLARELHLRLRVAPSDEEARRLVMGRGILLWLLGVPIPVIILLWLFFGH